MYLNCKTYFSYRWGTFSTSQLVEAAGQAGATSLALTNINNTSDIWSFVKLAQQAGIKPVAGVEFRNQDKLCYVMLAKNNEGFAKINRFLSQHLINKQAFPDLPEMDQDVYIIYPFAHGLPDHLEANAFIGIQATEINKLYGVDMKRYGQKMVILHPVTFQNKTYYELHQFLRAIDKNEIISKLQPGDIAGKHEFFVAAGRLINAFKDYPILVSNTFQLLDACSIQMDFKIDKNKKIFTASKEDDYELLVKLTYEGMEKRYGKNNVKAGLRVAQELKVISDLNFVTYFLIAQNIVQEASYRGYYHVGRGSGANSIVAYCLRITDVDPIELDLYFERFLNSSRTSPPDFDLDFSWQDRDDMIDYVFKRYGKEHVALLGMFSTFQGSSAIRELGKVLGLPKMEIDGLVEGQFHSGDKNHEKIKMLAPLMLDFPNHLSIHPGGMLICEEPIFGYTALDLPPKGFRITQIDMVVAEDIGLYKFDILSQRGLGHIREAIDIVKQTRGVDVDIHAIEKFKKDPKLAQNIKTGNTIGCFYIESPAMRQLLKKLRCEDYLRLVAASSIIRPGVGQSGMMQQYIYRFNNPGKFEYLHPVMQELLEETYGIMVYQEDVIKVCIHFAGMSGEDADILRRGMSGKFRSKQEMERVSESFHQGARALCRPEPIITEVWRQISSFAGYSFSKAHSASYAVESYQSLFLKSYYPVEFMVAVINNFGGFYSRELYFHELAKTGVKVHGPCINHSVHLTSIVRGEVYVGFIHVKGLEKKTIDSLLDNRAKNGRYIDLQDFVDRTHITEEQLYLLVKVGGLGFTGIPKRELLIQGSFVCRPVDKRFSGMDNLFGEQKKTFKLPSLEQTMIEDRIQELEILEFPLGNIFEIVDADVKQFPLARDLEGHINQQVTCLGYLICTKYAVTKKDKRTMKFGSWLDASGAWLDTVHFPDSNAMYPFKGRGFYQFTGKVVMEFGVITIVVETMQKIGIKSVD